MPTSPRSRRSPFHCEDGVGGNDWASSPSRQRRHSSSPTRLPREVKSGTRRRRSTTPPADLGDSNDFGSPRDRNTPPDRFHWTRRSPPNWTRSTQQNGRWKEVHPEEMAVVTTTRRDGSASVAANSGGLRRLAGKDKPQHYRGWFFGSSIPPPQMLQSGSARFFDQTRKCIVRI